MTTEIILCSPRVKFDKHDTDGSEPHLPVYHKVPKFSDARKLCCNLPKIQTNKQNLSIFRQKYTGGIANSEDPDQTAPRIANSKDPDQPAPLWVCTVCQVLSVRKIRVITGITSTFRE